MGRFAGFVALGSLVVSCQSYDFERVTPLAVAQTTTRTVVASKRLKPNVMLLVDTSGSMLLPTDTSNPACPANCGSAANPCPGGCPTRLSELKSAMGSFLASSGTLARFGVSLFPSNNLCGATSDIAVQLPDPTATDTGFDTTLAQNATKVSDRIMMAMAQGGTPTGASLGYAGTIAGLTDQNDARDDFVLLLTDGIPNCNVSNPNELCTCTGTMSCTPAQVSACECTQNSCTTSLCSTGCLDQSGAVGNVKGLLQKGIRTIVVGFGAEVASGSGARVLNAMAREGAFPRRCDTGAASECGAGNTCDPATKICSTAYYQVANGAELSAALAKITRNIMEDPCEYKLSSRPSEPGYLSVVIDGTSLAAGADTYSYDAGANTVLFTGELCTRLNNSTPQHSIDVEFRIVQRL